MWRVHVPHLILKFYCGYISCAVQVDAEKRREEQRKFGVFFDDDYNYLQHLKEPSPLSELVTAEPLNLDKGSFQLKDEEDEDEAERTVDSDVPVS